MRDADTRRDAGERAYAFDTTTVRGEGTTELTVIAVDRVGLFAALTGAIAASGASVLEAKIFTTNDGLALDTFLIQGAGGFPIEDKQGIARLKRVVERAALEPEVAAPQVPQRKLKSRERVFEVASSVSFNHDASDTYTVIEVNSRDRPGLLHDIAQSFVDQRLSVGSAHVSTFGENAVDVFYVRDRFGLKLKPGKHLENISAALTKAAG